MEDWIENGNLFMMCGRLNAAALTDIPPGYRIRPVRPEETGTWMAIHFDRPEDAEAFRPYMETYYANVYAAREDEFRRRCLMLCDGTDTPVGTCFSWRAYGRITAIHWFKVIRSHEGRGLGRALLSHVMRAVPPEEYPVYLHTQPSSYRAVKLYTDLGFSLLRDARIGERDNCLPLALPYFKAQMPEPVFRSLRFAWAPPEFLEAVASSPVSEL